MELTQLEKYVKAVQLLARENGATKKELEDELGLKGRAIQYLIDNLSNPFCMPEGEVEGRTVRYRIPPEKVAALKIFPTTEEYTLADITLFALLKKEMKSCPGLEKEFERLFHKIGLTVAASSKRGLLSESQLARTKIVKEVTISKEVRNQKNYRKVVNTLFEAINGNLWIKADYKGMYQEESHLLDIYPLVMISSNGDIYLYGLNYYEEVRMYALENFLSAEILKDKEKPKTKVDIDSLVADPFGMIIDSPEFTAKVWVNFDQGFYEIQKDWPKSVTYEEVADGYIFTLKTRSQYGLEEWVLKHAESMKVLSPEKVRDNVINRLKEALGLYK